MSSSIADRTDAAVKLVSEFIIEDKVERSVLWGDWGERSIMAASMSSAVMALLGVVVDVWGVGVGALSVGRTVTEAAAYISETLLTRHYD